MAHTKANAIDPSRSFPAPKKRRIITMTGPKTKKELEADNERMHEEKRQLEESLTAAQEATNVALAQIRQLESSSTSSSFSSGNESQGVPQKLELNFGKKCNLTTYVKTELYRDLKFVNDETLDAHPVILDAALIKMGIVSDDKKKQYNDATRKELKYILSQRRNYSKKMIMAKYNGKQ